MKVTNNLPTSFVVVALGSMWAAQQFVEEGAVLEVERAVRNDWIGSKLARDATDDEVAAYRAEQGDDSLDDLDEQRHALESEVGRLQQQKNELFDSLESDLEKRQALIDERAELIAEIAELEKAKAAAAEPVATDTKAGKK